jgi:hypothetical protein
MSMFFALLYLSAPEKLNMEKIIEMSFLYHSRLRRSDAYEEHGDVFFIVCPLCNCECKAPKIGMNCN